MSAIDTMLRSLICEKIHSCEDADLLDLILKLLLSSKS